MRLSKRLELVVRFAGRRGRPGAPDRQPGELYRIADVGTDHGYVPIALAERDAAVRAIAMDVRPGPLERAREHIREHGLEERIQTRLSDGVESLKAGEADTVVIAGMGGELVIHILEGGRHLWQSVERWVLSPQSELDKVRRYLEANGFVIADEEMVEEDGKYYTVMEAVRRQGGQSSVRDGAQEELAQARYLYGPKLIEKKSPVLMEFLQKEERALAGILAGLEGQDSPRSLERQEELRQKLSLIKVAVNEIG